MTNVDRYQFLLLKREHLNAESKKLEKEIYALNGVVREEILQKWHKIELKRRALSLEVARQWQTLTPEERKAQVTRYENLYHEKAAVK